MRSTRRSFVAATAAAGLIAASLGVGVAGAKPKANPLKGEGEGLKIIGNVAYAGGSDMEFLTIKGRDYAFTGSFASLKDGGGLHVIDITDPEKAKQVAHLPCSMSQSDIQISHDGKTVMMASDGAGGPESCIMANKSGFMTVDISNPKKPFPIGTAEIPRGSHNITAHPTKPYVYNSDSDVGNVRGEIQIWSIKDPAKPKLVNTVTTPGHSPHDISFNKKGDLAVTAGVDTIEIFDTSDPENPALVSLSQCPGCSIIHDAKFTPDGQHVVVGDEGGGGLPYPCPGGALYFYDLVGTPAAPVMVLRGVYEPDEVLLARDGQTSPGACTSHVFDFNAKGDKLAISWYSAGTRYLDISAYTGVTFGGNSSPGGVVELGWFMPDGGTSWSSKIHEDGYVFSNDIQRGFDIFKVVE